MKCRVIYVEASKEMEETLLKNGYEKRQGTFKKTEIAIVLKKKWFWFCSVPKELRDNQFLEL